MKVLSLFDGISSGQIALERAGIPVEVYYASEIDKYAIAVAMKNYPNTVQIGDVTTIDFTKYAGKIDLLIGGSPCQDLSIAKQNREGLKGERSRLFWKYVEALTVVKPTYFLLENVASMRKEDKEAITAVLQEVYPTTRCVMINSALVSGQQRKRYYWTNWDVEQPEDKGITLQDVLEKDIAFNDKSFCIDASYYKGSNLYQTCTKHRRTLVATPCALRNRGEGKKPEFNGTEKANALTTVQTDSMVCIPIRLGHFNKGGQGDRVYSVQGKSISLSANGGGRGAKTGLYKIDLPDGDYKIRKLTPIECERLQTLPDNYTLAEGVSATQRYKALGNGWTVDVIAHILKGIQEQV